MCAIFTSEINECLVNNGQCEQRCIDTVEGRFCACYPGYEVFEIFQCKLAGKLFSLQI